MPHVMYESYARELDCYKDLMTLNERILGLMATLVRPRCFWHRLEWILLVASAI